MTVPKARMRPAQRRSQLVDVATELFVERGYGNVSVSDIARVAGISGPSMYRHFPDKQAILAAAMQSAVEEMSAITATVLAEPGATFERLTSAVFAMAVSKPGPLALWRWNRRHLTADQAKELASGSDELLGRWAGILRRERPDLTLDDARVLAWAVLAVGGSVPPSRGRIGVRRYRTDLETIAQRVLSAPPSTAPALLRPAAGRTAVLRSEEILDAASELFFTRGYSAVSLDDIGAAVGISGPSVYGHFPSKASILLGIGSRAAAALEVGTVLAAAPDPISELRSLVRAYAGNLVSSTDLAVAFTVGREVVIESGGELLLAAQKSYVARWVALLATATDPSAARIAVGAAMTIANDFARTRRLRRRPRFYDELVALMDAALGIAA